jgi:hypothetical protein
MGDRPHHITREKDSLLTYRLLEIRPPRCQCPDMAPREATMQNLGRNYVRCGLHENVINIGSVEYFFL